MTAIETDPCIERRSGERRRKQVLDAAEQCFCRYGFHNASMAQIAAAAGMSVGHIYRYLPSKEAIIVAIVQRDAAQALDDIAELETDPANIRCALLSHVRRMIQRVTAPDRVALILEILAEAARNPRVASVIQEGYGKVQARLVEILTSRRSLTCSEAQMHMRLEVLDLILAGLLLKAVKTPDFDPEAVAGLAADCIAEMVGATEGDAPSGAA